MGDDLQVIVARPDITAVLLDRDGVINEPVIDPRSGRHESPYRADDVVLIEGIVEFVRGLHQHAIPVAVVSNQPAAAKQTQTRAELADVDARVRELIAEEGAAIPVWRYCFHHPEGSDPTLGVACACRKPGPALLTDALHELGVEPSRSVIMVGDSDADIGAGKSLGLYTVLVEHPETAHRRGICVPDVTLVSVTGLSNLLETDD